jgi:transcription-repair coupling factor (superfamily II helicase)
MNPPSIFSPPWPSKNQQKFTFGNLVGSSAALLIAHLARESQKSLLIVTPDSLSAQRLELEIAFFAQELKACMLNFPDWETLPYDVFSPHQDIISTRIKTLYQLHAAKTNLQIKQNILITPITSLMNRLPPVEHFTQGSFVLNTGERIQTDRFRAQLQKNGYYCVQQVFAHGEFAYRGSIIDIFPMGSAFPIRIDLLDDEVDSLRKFDPETQRSTEKIASIEILPAHEFPLSEEGISVFRQNWRARFEGNPLNCPVYQSVTQGTSSPGIEYYLPLFFEGMHTLFDYLPEDTLVLVDGDCHATAEKFWQEIKERYEQRRFDVTRPILEPSLLFLETQAIFSALKNFPQIQLMPNALPAENATHINFSTENLPEITIDYRAENPLKNFVNFLEQQPLRTLLVAETNGRREVLLELLNKADQHPVICQDWESFVQSSADFCLTVAPMDRGFYLNEAPILKQSPFSATGYALITESQLLGQQIMQRRLRRPKKNSLDAIVRDLAELRIGSPVVHVDHGIGCYLGLKTFTFDNVEAEFLTLEYSGSDKLYVPVSSLHLISRYTGVSDKVPFSSLGTQQWKNAKRKAIEQIRDVAAELLEVYAKREAHQGFAFTQIDGDYARFSAGFPFELTHDQQKSVTEVIKDMSSPRPMDRVICGDVGFGKTEVAMRAAFIAVNNGKQVAVLVPTTLLAQQHYQNFCDRFADWPIQIEVISRFRTKKEQTEIVQKLADQKIDILIGTHKLLQAGVEFNKLGLLIIDEEHRFGVQQKERFKALRSEVDILTLTATPIPRTLNMAFSGLRELSIIATPPARRLSVKTFVHEKNHLLIQEAILRELLRGGQVYWVHNDVSTIEKAADEIRQLVPEARVHTAHGQMREKELERIMADFYHQRFNVLVCTTIIETGIDIPTANTMIIDRADKFGLAQLHQLRGRVGRSHHQAYAYLIIPPEASISKEATKRLEAIASFEELGAGFALATHDLEIRGAGQLLGEDQSGNMHAIGFSLYTELLELAIADLQREKNPETAKPLSIKTEIDLKVPALIPEHYMGDVHIRLTLYKRLSEAVKTTQIDDIQVEMIDRFGFLPAQTKNLLHMTRLKLMGAALGITRVEANKAGGFLEFTETPLVDPDVIIKLISQQAERFKMEGPKRLRFFFEKPLEGEERIVAVERVLNGLGRNQVGSK